MAKRFTDTDKWNKAWFRKLGSEGRDLWQYLHDSCDYAGLIDIDFDRMEFALGTTITKERINLVTQGRAKWISGDKVFLPDFIQFQYGPISSESKMHRNVITRLANYGIDAQKLQGKEPWSYPEATLQEEEKEQSSEKELEKEKAPPLQRVRGFSKLNVTPDSVVNLYNHSLGHTNGFSRGLGCGEHLRHLLEAKEFLSDLNAWEELFKKTAASKFLTGDNPRKWRAPLVWLVNYDNAQRVLADEFTNDKAGEDLYAKLRELETA
jgi:hypothetical protein